MLQLIKTYKLTTVLLIVIWVLCFMPIPETPLSHVQLIDKWTHTAMYLGLGLVIAFELLLSGKTFQTKQIRADTSHEVSALLVIFVLRKNI